MSVARPAKLRAIRTVLTIVGLIILIWFGMYQTNRANILASRHAPVSQPRKPFIQEDKTSGASENQNDDVSKIAGIATIVVPLLQSLIFLRQASLMRRSADIYDKQAGIMSGQLKAAVDAANAAKISADAAQMSAVAAIGVELPQILLSRVGFVCKRQPHDREFLRFPLVSVEVKNFGRTPAFVIERSVEVECFGLRFPDMPPYRQSEALPAGTVIEAKDLMVFPDAKPVRQFSANEISGVFDLTHHLAVYGFVIYRDFLGKKSIARFYREYFPGMMGGIFSSWKEGNPPKSFTENAYDIEEKAKT